MKKALIRVLAAGIAALVVLLVAEIISRMLPWAPTPPTTIYDAKTGFRERSGMSGTFTVEHAGHFTFNSYGFRDVEWSPAKQKKFRVAVLGDSFVEALQVDLDQTFPKLIEKQLHDTEVMNFGISGQGQVEELLTYRQYVRPFKPDLVILAFFPGNDPIDNWRRREPSLRFPVFVTPSLKGVEITPVPGVERMEWKRKLIDSLMYHCSLMQRLQDVRRARLRRGLGGVTEAGLWDGAFGNAAGKVKDFDAMWQLTEKLVLQLNRDVSADTGRTNGLLVVCLNEGVQVHRAQREQFMKQHPGLDPDYAEARMRGYCESNGIPFLALSPDMIRINESTGKLLYGFEGKGSGHLNQDGHRVTAEAIAGRLKAMLP
jgi:hypothetical protein